MAPRPTPRTTVIAKAARNGDAVDGQQRIDDRAEAHGAADREVDVTGDHQQREGRGERQQRRGHPQDVDDVVLVEEISALKQAELVEVGRAQQRHDRDQHEVDVVVAQELGSAAAAGGGVRSEVACVRHRDHRFLRASAQVCVMIARNTAMALRMNCQSGDSTRPVAAEVTTAGSGLRRTCPRPIRSRPRWPRRPAGRSPARRTP